MEMINEWIAQWGYGGIFSLLVLGIVGLPVPDETMLTFVGYLAYKGQLDLLPALLTVFSGSICGITLSYILGRTLGLKILHKYGRYVRMTPEKLQKTHMWFERSGKWVLMIGYFIPGVRHFTAYVAGATELKLPEFALFAYAGGLIWSVGFVMLGYLLGEQWETVLHAIHDNLLIACIVAAVLIAGYILWRYTKNARKKREKLAPDSDQPSGGDRGDEAAKALETNDRDKAS